MTAARWLVIALAVASIGLFAASFKQVWWKFLLYAPQYPHDLALDIKLTGLAGDVKEIDMLNHYIGMGHLEDAAPMERRLAGYAVAGVAIMVVSLALLAGKRVTWAAILPGLAFPLGFVADSFYWLHRFGHALDPHAPLRIKGFTPEMFGNGTIGQFMTYAEPGTGFWMAVAAVPLLLIAVIVRARVCHACALEGSCGYVCPRALVVPPKAAS